MCVWTCNYTWELSFCVPAFCFTSIEKLFGIYLKNCDLIRTRRPFWLRFFMRVIFVRCLQDDDYLDMEADDDDEEEEWVAVLIIFPRNFNYRFGQLRRSSPFLPAASPELSKSFAKRALSDAVWSIFFKCMFWYTRLESSHTERRVDTRIGHDSTKYWRLNLACLTASVARWSPSVLMNLSLRFVSLVFHLSFLCFQGGGRGARGRSQEGAVACLRRGVCELYITFSNVLQRKLANGKSKVETKAGSSPAKKQKKPEQQTPKAQKADAGPKTPKNEKGPKTPKVIVGGVWRRRFESSVPIFE